MHVANRNRYRQFAETANRLHVLAQDNALDETREKDLLEVVLSKIPFERERVAELLNLPREVVKVPLEEITFEDAVQSLSVSERVLYDLVIADPERVFSKEEIAPQIPNSRRRRPGINSMQVSSLASAVNKKIGRFGKIQLVRGDKKGYKWIPSSES